MTNSKKVSRPSPGRLYHAVFPGRKYAKIADPIRPSDLDAYTEWVGRKVAWVYFSNEWSVSQAFPTETAAWVRDRGAVPFIRLMLRSFDEPAFKPEFAEKRYLLDNILRGCFDKQLHEWGAAARAFGAPLLVEYGTECNLPSFCWNGAYNGKESGPPKFAEAYRHIVRQIRDEGGADNVTWVFHVNATDDLGDDWNRLERYYPGDVVDWVGVSCYGAQKPAEDCESFGGQMATVYGRLSGVAPSKPVIVAEFGCVDGCACAVKAHGWADAALEEMLRRAQGDWPNLIGFAWWNECWRNDYDAPVHDPATDSNMLVQENRRLAEVFRARLKNPRVVETPS